MTWPKGKRRNDAPECAEMLKHIGSLEAIAKIAGVSKRAVQHWRAGTKRPSMETLEMIIDHFCGTGTGKESDILSGSGLSEDYFSSSARIVFGVSQYSLDAASGDYYESDLFSRNCDN